MNIAYSFIRYYQVRSELKEMRFSIALFMGLATALTSVAQYKIEVNIDGLADNEVYLGYHLGQSKYIEDTAAMNEGKAIFQGEEELTHGIYFIYTPNYFLELVITEEQQFQLSSNTTDPLQAKKVEGSRQNEIFHQFQLKLAETQSKSNELKAGLESAQSREDTVAIYEKIQAVEVANKEFQDQLAAENPDSYVAAFLNLIRKPADVEAPEGLSEQEVRQYKFQSYKDRFFDGIDFTYEGMLRTPLFQDRIIEYVDRLTSPEPDSLIATADFLIGKAEPNPDVFRYILVTLTNKFSKPKLMGHDAVFVHLAENYYLTGKATWATEEMIENFTTAVNDLKPNLIGEVAPSLQLLDTTLSPISLNDIVADYTVLFFYDPDCGHCKKMAPVALDFYHQYRAEGVETIGVCIATDMDKWKKFVYEKGLDWINGADPYFQSNFRKEYNILSTPTIYILDRDKKIIGKRIGVEQLSDFIDVRLRIDAGTD